jgi:hypothetical protein
VTALVRGWRLSLDACAADSHSFIIHELVRTVNCSVTDESPHYILPDILPWLQMIDWWAWLGGCANAFLVRATCGMCAYPDPACVRECLPVRDTMPWHQLTSCSQVQALCFVAGSTCKCSVSPANVVPHPVHGIPSPAEASLTQTQVQVKTEQGMTQCYSVSVSATQHLCSNTVGLAQCYTGSTQHGTTIANDCSLSTFLIDDKHA